MKVVIIDSGVSSKHEYSCSNIKGVTISDLNGKCIIDSSEFEDKIGHGTAVIDVFLSNSTNDIELFIIKIFKEDFTTSFDLFCNSLEYIINNIECNMILISSGIRIVEDFSRLNNLIKTIYDKNIIIVSAFDNNGSMSYPASFEEVIGVDVSNRLKKKEEYVVYENSLINILGTNSSFRVKWVNPNHNIMKGSSFTAAYIAGLLARYMAEQDNMPRFNDCINFLKDNAVNSISNNQSKKVSQGKDFIKRIKKAIVFPFNKEIHSIASFEELLYFDIVGYFDIRQSGISGMKICDISKHINNKSIIRNYTEIEWNSDFDTVILGHIEQISALTGNDYISEFIENANKYGKMIYAFDDINRYLDSENVNFFSSNVTDLDIPKNRLDKLRVMKTPVVGIYGTSSRQGKHTLQLMLRKLFLNDGYKVSQIGTEPSGYLFGFDEVYPMGYNSSVYIKSYDAINTLNEMMYNCETSDPDIIITGCQSSTVPIANYNLKYYNITQIEFILGTQPDLIILCVNVHDSINYIKRTINFIEGICECRMIAFVVYPKKIELEDNIINLNLNISDDEFKSFSDELKVEFNRKIFFLNNNKSILSLYNYIIYTLENNV